jgi:hypothetical protein
MADLLQPIARSSLVGGEDLDICMAKVPERSVEAPQRGKRIFIFGKICNRC